MKIALLVFASCFTTKTLTSEPVKCGVKLELCKIVLDDAKEAIVAGEALIESQRDMIKQQQASIKAAGMHSSRLQQRAESLFNNPWFWFVGGLFVGSATIYGLGEIKN